MVMCSMGRSWYRDLWDKKTRERNKEPDLIEANVSWAPWAHGCLEGRRRDINGAQAKAGVTSVSRLHDATNAVALKEVDKFFFDQRTSLEVVTIDRHSGEIRHMA